MGTKMIPCPNPWCQSEKITVVLADTKHGWTGNSWCEDCNLTGPLVQHADEDEASELAKVAWNRRPVRGQPQELAAAEDGLKGALMSFALIKAICEREDNLYLAITKIKKQAEKNIEHLATPPQPEGA